MKFAIAWIAGALLLAVIPIGFGDSVFANYLIGILALTVGVAAWAWFSRERAPESQG